MIQPDLVVCRRLTLYDVCVDGYNGKNVFVYITLKNVGSVKESVSCDFTENSFDVKVMNLDGVNYRLIKQPLNKV